MGKSYGPAAVEIISSAIWSLIDDHDLISETLQGTLYDLILNQKKTVTTFNGFWKDADGRSILLTNFIEYIAIPHTANLLISEDLHENDARADEVRHISMNYGMAFNMGNDDHDDVSIGEESQCGDADGLGLLVRISCSVEYLHALPSIPE